MATEGCGGRAQCKPRYAGQGRRPMAPTDALPASEAKIAVLCERSRQGAALFDPRDLREHESRGLELNRQGEGTGGLKGNHAVVVNPAKVIDQKEFFRGGGVTAHSCDYERLGARISYFRRRKQLSQKELAGRVGVAEFSVRRWEKGDFRPNLRQLVRMTGALDVGLDDLVGIGLIDPGSW